MNYLPRIALFTVFFSLSACQMLSPSGIAQQPFQFEHKTPNCKGDDCPLVNIESFKVPDNPALTRIVEQRLLELAQQSSPDNIPKANDLRSYERNFLERANKRQAVYLQAEIIEQRPNWAIIELSSYLELGGAHGLPGRGFINYDLQHSRETTLKDWLVPGKEEQFWRAVQRAHQRWLVEKELTNDPTSLENYLKQWPFTQTNNIALTPNELLLKYAVYTLAPYSSGHPQLKIPYSELKGILRDEVIPR